MARLLATFAGVAVVVSALVFLITPRYPIGFGLAAVLIALAVVSEFLPVEFPRRGVRVTFALAYVSILAVEAGPAWALVADIVATTLVSFVLMRRRAGNLGTWMAFNASISVISIGCGAMLLELSRPGLEAAGWIHEVGSLVFIAGYTVGNAGGIILLERNLSPRAWRANVAPTLRVAGLGLALYALVALVVAVLVKEGVTILIPLTLVPVWALRTALQYRAKTEELYYETITALSQMLQRAHPYTHGHLERVASTAEEVARRLGLGARRAKLVREAAVLHDIGKIAVDEEILDKPGKLTPEELAHVRLHPEWGAEILTPIQEFEPLIPWIRHHHERPDGRGYPDALHDHQIPIESKIIAVVDAFDAMTGETPSQRRPYREPMSEDEALAELERCAGTQFDLRVVEAFRATIRGGEPR